jgi:DNA-binding CsgD family transcriptional regulator/tetratricopeptide (TPR) repeat protein
MRARVTSARFVGRTQELAELEAALADAASGRPALVLLGGDSGVGKTRLLAEFQRRALADGARVLRGEGLEHGEDELPYAPLTSSLRPLVRERDRALEAISAASRAELATLLPGLDRAEVATGAARPAGQLRLFEALLDLVAELSADSALALVLDDLQWADRSTRTFVSFLVRALRDERVMLLVAYRSDDLHRRHALRPLLSELERLERARRVDLLPFDVEESTEALTDILGAAPAPELVQRLHARSEGNPLYTEELLAAGLDGRGPAPPSLRDAFLLRVERLSEPARRVVRALAAGQRLDEVTLARVTGLEAHALNEALREAVDEQVLATGGQRLSFRHSLLREAVYDDLLPGERGQLHLALAEALEERSAGAGDADFAAPIAYHYAAAGEQPAALAATVAAARAASALHAYGEAAELLERALELWPRVSDAAVLLQSDHAQLLSLAADAHELGGDRAREEMLREAALAEAGSQGDARRRAVLLGQLARAQWALNRGEKALASAQAALALLPETAGVERAGLLAWLARTRALRGRYRDAVRDAREALASAEAVDDLSIQGQALNTLGMSLVVLGEVEQGVASLRRALEIAREAQDPDGESGAYSNLAELLHMAGRTSEALATAREGLATISGDRRRRGRDWVSLTVSELAFESGDWELARAQIGSSSHPQVGRHRIFHELRRAELALGVGDLDLAERSLLDIETLVAASFEPQWHAGHGALLAEVRRRQGDLAGAQAAVQDALDRMEVCTDDVMRIARVTAVGLGVEADRAQRARDLHEPAQAKDALARARIHMRRLQAAASEGGPVERAWRALGQAELGRARGRNEPRYWAAAAERWAALGRPYQSALAVWRKAEAEIERGERRAAAESARAALAAARRIGAEWVGGELESLCRRARLDPRSNGSADPATARAPAPFGLTERERQVLALVAQGATNRQIGAALFMAEKTASVHVSRILAKLDVHTRTQAAAVAHRLHLG